jgi:hypothetical protein
VNRRGVIYLRRQDAAEGLACAHQSGAGTVCGLTAHWHVLLTTQPQAAAVLLCDPHMQIVAINNPWWDRHPATAACAQPQRTWQHDTPSHCTT